MFPTCSDAFKTCGDGFTSSGSVFKTSACVLLMTRSGVFKISVFTSNSDVLTNTD